MKRIVSLVLAISLVLSMFVSAFAATKTFEDIKDTEYASSVEALVELGVIDGLPDGTYGPEKEVTRAQLAKMLVICLGLGDTVEALEGKTIFTDVADSHWASGYINAAVQTKVIAGYPDGTFKPEKNVSYAEAITMVIRALGYGNVVDAEGSWPTSYMLKAVELELLDGVEGAKQEKVALRGNVAVILWNMLRTPMWKITSESEGMGMTSKADAVMLNVKFPSYRYVEDMYLQGISINEQEVEATIDYVKTRADDVEYSYDPITAKVVNEDLVRLVKGMKVAALIKDYKDSDDATFLTLTPENKMVEGVVTKDATSTKVEIDGVEYKVENSGLEADDYVVAEVVSKKIENFKVLVADDNNEVKKLNRMEADIDEEALVIADGEWTDRKAIEIGDVYTEINASGDDVIIAGNYFVSTSERVTGAFESYTYQTNTEKDLVYIVVDGEQYKAFEDLLEDNIFEGEENDQNVEIADLRVKKSENKYLDHEVELVLNYLGQVIGMKFGEVSDLEADGNFYVVTSNGIFSDVTKDGMRYYINLVGTDGEEKDPYTFAKSFDYEAVEDVLGLGTVYARASGDDGVATFVYVVFNDAGEIKKIAMLEDGFASGDYEAVEFSGELTDDDYLGAQKVSDSTVVFRATPVKDAEGDFDKFEIEVTEGKEALNRVDNGLVAYDVENNRRAKFVFVSENAKSDKTFGILTDAVDNTADDVRVTIDGEVYNLSKLLGTDVEDLESGDVKQHVGSIVEYTEENGKVTIENVIAIAIVNSGDEAHIVTKVDDYEVTFSGDQVPVAGELDNNPTEDSIMDVTKKDTEKAYEDMTFVKIEVTYDKDNGYKVEFVEVKTLGLGIESAVFAKGDRMVIDAANETVLIITGLAHDDVVENGAVVVE